MLHSVIGCLFGLSFPTKSAVGGGDWVHYWCRSGESTGFMGMILVIGVR